MINFSISVPVFLLNYYSKSEIQRSATEFCVWNFLSDGLITRRKAARLLNMSQKEFSNLLQTPRMILLQHIKPIKDSHGVKELMKEQNTEKGNGV